MRIGIETRGLRQALQPKNLLEVKEKVLIVCDASFGTPEQVQANTKLRRAHVPISGVNTEFQQISKNLPQLGYEVSNINPAEYPHFQLNVFPDAIPSLPLLLKRRIKKENPDAALVITPEAPIGLVTLLACKRLGIPSIAFYTSKIGEMISQNIDNNLRIVFDPLQKLLRREVGLSSHVFDFLFKFIYNKATTITVPTPEMQSRLEKWGVKPDKIRIWDRGVDTNLFSPPQVGEQNPYTNYSWYQDTGKVLIFVGRLQAEKNLEAFLAMKTPGYTKVVVGEGPEKKRLQKKYPETQFLGAKKPEAVAEFVKFATGMVQPSKYETLGLSACESTCAGTPVLSFDVEGLDRAIIHGVTGYRVQSSNDMLEDIGNLEKGLTQLEQIDRTVCAQESQKKYSLAASMQNLSDIIHETRQKGKTHERTSQ